MAEHYQHNHLDGQMDFTWQMPYVRQGLPKISFQQNVRISFTVTAKKSYFERILCIQVPQSEEAKKLEKLCNKTTILDSIE